MDFKEAKYLNDLKKKARIIQLMMEDLEEMHRQTGHGMDLYRFSAAHNRRCHFIGGFPEILKEMIDLGYIDLRYDDDGKRTVWLPGFFNGKKYKEDF